MIDNFIKCVNNHSVNQTDFFKLTALTGELGELANVIKKAEFFNMFPDSYAKRVLKEMDEGTRKTFREQFVDEAGDTLFYFIQLLEHWNVSIEEVMKYQMNKLELQDNALGRTFKK